MKNIFFGLFFSLIASQANSTDYIVKEHKNVSGVGFCSIEAYKDSFDYIQIHVTCGKGGGKFGNCNSLRKNDSSSGFSCETHNGNRSHPNGVSGSINWILRNM